MWPVGRILSPRRFNVVIFKMKKKHFCWSSLSGFHCKNIFRADPWKVYGLQFTEMNGGKKCCFEKLHVRSAFELTAKTGKFGPHECYWHFVNKTHVSLLKYPGEMSFLLTVFCVCVPVIQHFIIYILNWKLTQTILIISRCFTSVLPNEKLKNVTVCLLKPVMCTSLDDPICDLGSRNIKMLQ